MNLSLEDQLAFYGAFHTKPANVAIHLLFVPCIFFTALILLHGLPSPSFLTVPLPFNFPGFSTVPAAQVVQITPAFLVALGYASYFIALDPIAGGLYAPILLTFGHLSNVFGDRIKPAAVLHVASWIAQFVGHGVVSLFIPSARGMKD